MSSITHADKFVEATKNEALDAAKDASGALWAMLQESPKLTITVQVKQAGDGWDLKTKWSVKAARTEKDELVTRHVSSKQLDLPLEEGKDK